MKVTEPAQSEQERWKTLDLLIAEAPAEVASAYALSLIAEELRTIRRQLQAVTDRDNGAVRVVEMQ